MAGGIDWFRWHHGSVTDPKFQLVARKAGVRLPDVLAVWAFVLEKASASDERGTFGDIDCESVDCLFGLDDGKTAAILEQMQARGLVDDGGVSAWEKRQPKRERETDNSTSRVREYRQRQKQQGEATGDDETPCNASETQETPRGEDSREDISPSLRSGESAPASPAPPPAQPKTKGRKPKSEAITLATYLANCKADGVKPISESHFIRAWADDAGVTSEMLQIAWVKFRERYTKGERGKGKRYKDWPAHFATAVQDNWFKLWFADAEGVRWTSNGLTCKAVLDARQQQEESHA